MYSAETLSDCHIVTLSQCHSVLLLRTLHSKTRNEILPAKNQRPARKDLSRLKHQQRKHTFSHLFHFVLKLLRTFVLSVIIKSNNK